VCDKGPRPTILIRLGANELAESIDQSRAIVKFLSEKLQARTRAASFFIILLEKSKLFREEVEVFLWDDFDIFVTPYCNRRAEATIN
jgi:hypothetical protein